MSSLNQSILISGGATFGGASILPAVQWLLAGCPRPVPVEVSALVAGLVVAAVHFGINYLNARAKAPAEKPQ